MLKPGQTVKLHARLFDAKGRFLREEESATWSLDGLKGTVNDGTYAVASEPVESAGLIKATVGGLTATARAHVVHPLPWTETFEEYPDGAVPPGWINAVAGKFKVETLDGSKVLAKAPDETLFKRIRMFIGPTDWSNYTFEADVRSNTKRRQMGDIGITAQRYSLILYGNEQAIEDRAVGAGSEADGDGSVRMEGGQMVSPESPRGEYGGREGSRAREGVADGRDRAGAVDRREDRSDRESRRALRECSRMHSSACTWII